MNKHNRKLLLACLVILIAVTMSITVFFCYVRLDGPLFLKNYCEYEWNADGQDMSGLLRRDFAIQYLSNADDSRLVTGIEFPDLKDEPISFYAIERATVKGGFSANVQKLKMYSLHTVSIQVRCLFSVAEREDTDVVLQNALIRFNDGSTQAVNLGEIKLYWRNCDNQRLLPWIQTVSSNDGFFEETLQSNENFTIIGLRWSPCVESAELFNCTLNGIDVINGKIDGVVVKQGEIVTIQTVFPQPDELVNKFSLYELRVILTVQDSKGVPKEIDVHPICYTPFPDFWDIFQYALTQK